MRNNRMSDNEYLLYIGVWFALLVYAVYKWLCGGCNG